VFIDLEKEYDSISREVLWECLEKKEVQRAYIRAIKDMLEVVKTSVKSSAGNTEYFSTKIRLHHDSALSPFLFTILMDELTGEIQNEVPWCMLFAYDIALIDETLGRLSKKL